MDFKRHHQHQGFNFNSRPNNPGNGSHGGYQPGTFAHHPHPPHNNSRPFKLNEGHNGGRGLNLTVSFRNLLKLEGEMIGERINGFQKTSQFRDLMISRISTISNNLLKDEFFDSLIAQVKELLVEEEKKSKAGIGEGKNDQQNKDSVVAAAGKDENVEKNNTAKETVGGIEDIKNRLRSQVREAVNGIVEETRIYALREESIMGNICAKERRVEKDFMEFFNEAERQIMDYEKKIRNDQYGQMITRLRSAEREMAMRDQKIMQLEDALKIVGERSEKAMAELQQVNADHQFEKLQLYHHVEVSKFNTKCMALEELMRICKWKRCTCGRDYDEIFREFEVNFNPTFNGGAQDCFAMGRFKEFSDRRDLSCTSSWIFPTGQSQVAPSQAIPAGSFIPSEEAATKGTVLNDLRDRYDELQLKAAVTPNYEEVRAMIMKIVCHFKTAGLRVCEEMRGKQFVSSLFYCNSDDLVPSKSDKTFSTGFGDTPEEATLKSVQRALSEIHRIETESVASVNDGPEMIFVRRNPSESVLGKLDKEAIRMTLLRSYCNQKVDDTETLDIRCLQEGNLYQNQANAQEKYLADWKIHIRVEDSQESGIKEKLQRVLRAIKDVHMSDFIDHRPQNDKLR